MSTIYRLGCFFFILILFFHSNLIAKDNLILCNDGVVNSRAIGEINKIGTEIKEKTGISIYLCVKKSIKDQKIKLFEKELTLKIKKPYIILTLAVKDQKVDIATSKNTKNLIDIDSVLSPFTGTIIPILTSRKTKDKYSAAMLNGYADIADRVAGKKNIKLNSSIGDTNRILVDILRIIIYSAFLYFIVMYARKKYIMKKKRNEKK